MQDSPKAFWNIPYVSVAFFPSLKQKFIAYRSSKVPSRPDCILEIHQLWQSGFSRMYFNSCSSCSFEPEIIKFGQSSHTIYSNNIRKRYTGAEGQPEDSQKNSLGLERIEDGHRRHSEAQIAWTRDTEIEWENRYQRDSGDQRMNNSRSTTRMCPDVE